MHKYEWIYKVSSKIAQFKWYGWQKRNRIQTTIATRPFVNSSNGSWSFHAFFSLKKKCTHTQSADLNSWIQNKGEYTQQQQKY